MCGLGCSGRQRTDVACVGMRRIRNALAPARVSALREAVAMKRWPVAKGRVLSSTIEQYKATAGAGDFGSTRTHMTLYRPKVVYEYEAAGQRFKGDRIAQSPGFNRECPFLLRRRCSGIHVEAPSMCASTPSALVNLSSNRVCQPAGFSCW